MQNVTTHHIHAGSSLRLRIIKMVYGIALPGTAIGGIAGTAACTAPGAKNIAWPADGCTIAVIIVTIASSN